MLSDTKSSILDGINPFADNDTGDEFNFGKYFKLSYEQRLYGFGIFAIIGILLSFIGTLTLFSMQLVTFAILYTLGKISMVLATLFLFGPMNQLKSMCSSVHRGISVAVYFTMLILVLVVAFTLKNPVLCIVLVIFETIAYLWYTITSIPGGQFCCKSCFTSVVNI
jgi:hypothetical protein